MILCFKHNANLKPHLHYKFYFFLENLKTCFLRAVFVSPILAKVILLTLTLIITDSNAAFRLTHESTILLIRVIARKRPVYVFCRWWIPCCGRSKRATAATELLSRYAPGIFNRASASRAPACTARMRVHTRRVHTRVSRRERPTNRRRRSGR